MLLGLGLLIGNAAGHVATIVPLESVVSTFPS